RANVPIRISHSHSHYPTNSMLTKIKRELFHMLLPFYATNFFACSKQAAEWLYGKKIVQKNNYEIIYNAIAVEKFSFDHKIREKIRSELGLSNSTVFVHVGMFTDAKNHDFLIKVFKEINDKDKSAILLLIGDGEKKE